MALSHKSGTILTASDESKSAPSKQASVSSLSNIATADKVSADHLTASSAVTSLAETVDLPVAGDLREATTTLQIQKQLSQTDAEVISKPDIIQPVTRSGGIVNYVVKEGESLADIADKHQVSTQTIRWANGMASESVEPGKEILVPTVDGVVYTVKGGDTIEDIASKYKADVERIVLHNDIDLDQPLADGFKIILPNGDLPETERPGYVAPRQNSYSGSYGYGNMSGSVSSRAYGYGGMSSGNRYSAGNCTWYAYERRAQIGRPIGGLWGNAYSWAASARGAGFVVNNSPAVGAVIQTSSGGGGYGHVGVVERFEGDNMIISDMNYAGYNVVTWRSIPMSQAGGYFYIH